MNRAGRTNGWLNDAAQLTTIQSATSLDGMITAAVVDAGVGGVTYFAKAGTEFIRPTVEELTIFNNALKTTQEQMLAEREAKGMKARDLYARIRQLVGDAKA